MTPRGNAAAGAVIAYTDITERKLAAEEVAHNAAKLSLALTASRMGVWDLDLETDKIVLSPGCYQIFGFDSFDGNRETFRQLIHPDDREAIRLAFDEAIRSRTVFDKELRIVQPNGEIRWISNRAQIQVIPGEAPRRVIGTVRDITRRKDNEAALQASEHRFRQLIERNRVVAWEGKLGTFDFGYVSEFCEELLGYPRDTWYESGFWAAHLHPDDRTHAIDFCLAASAALEDHSFEYRMVHADGREIWVHDVVNVVSVDGKLTGVRGVLVDITDRKLAELAVLGQNRVLEEIAAEQPLAVILKTIVEFVETQLPGCLCSILLLDHETQSLRMGAGQSLPTAYNQAIDGIKIGPTVGSCGTAAYFGKPVVVTDIATDPLWAAFAELALGYGLRSCWSVPIFDGGCRTRPDAPVRVLGTLAMYRKEPGEPASRSNEVLTSAADLVGVAIERDAVSAKLRQSERRFRSVLDTSPNIVFLKDLEGRYLFVNHRMAEVRNTAQDDWLGKTCYDLFPRDVADQYIVRDRRVLETRIPEHMEEPIPLQDGTELTILWVVFPLLDESGKPYALCGIGSDITERKRIENSLRHAQAIAQVGNWRYDLAAGVLTGSEEGLRIMGKEPGTLAPIDFYNLVHPEDRYLLTKAWESILAGGDFDVELRMVVHGQPKWIDVHAVAQRDSNGGLREVFGITQDVTHRRQLEQQLRQSQKMNAVGLLAGGIAHDFNNILTVILGHCDLAQLEAPDNPILAEIAIIRDAGERAAKLTQQLLAFSRKQILNPVVLKLNEVIRQSAVFLRRLIGEHIVLSTDLAPDLGFVKIDERQMEQVLLNLAINASDAMPTGGRLIVRARNVTLIPSPSAHSAPSDPKGERDFIELTVTDTGVGMTPEVRCQIFEPFFTTKEIARGTGLGLSVVHGIIHQSGGQIDVESEPGHGSTFRILLPAVTEPAHVAISKPPSVPTRGSETILLVEDEPRVREIARTVLQRQGYNVLEAGAGTQAIEIFIERDGAIDLLLTDVVMPEMSGRQVADLLRARKPGLRVIYMSGYTDDEVVRHGVMHAQDQFLQKPLEMMSLMRKVRETLDSPIAIRS
ncbi:MAG: PAS domain S-box protein [Planctomycetota bacterium]|nr:PAS domain S-box protein [Planctomycetota bacterium]